MKQIIVYVEGPSDRNALEKLMDELIRRKLQQGTMIKFRAHPGGKDQFVHEVPRKAADIICHAPRHEVTALPDLYPPNKGFPHSTCDELRNGLVTRFEERVRVKNIQSSSRLKSRFHVYCFKYDLEVLVLAAEERLRKHLGVSELPVRWVSPVEDQDHDDPPKKVVQRLFAACGRTYVETEDGPEIVGAADYRDLKRHCPQCFGPFVDYLESL